MHYLKAFDQPMAFELQRVFYGQEEDTKPAGFIGYRGDGEWPYRTPFERPIRMDDEIAMVRCLEKVAYFVKTGNGFYSLAEGSQDVYLSLLYERAISEDCAVESETQIWAS